MPELLTMQDLANGHLDIKALGEAANGDENTIVTTRTGNTYPSAERAINIMFKNGGLPATPFKTKALMTASSLPDGKYAMVTDDIANNGLYVKTAGAWVKSSYDPLALAKTDVVESKAYILSKVENVFLTLADMNASSLPVYTFASVVNDTNIANNGFYQKGNTQWFPQIINKRLSQYQGQINDTNTDIDKLYDTANYYIPSISIIAPEKLPPETMPEGSCLLSVTNRGVWSLQVLQGGYDRTEYMWSRMVRNNGTVRPWRRGGTEDLYQGIINTPESIDLNTYNKTGRLLLQKTNLITGMPAGFPRTEAFLSVEKYGNFAVQTVRPTDVGAARAWTRIIRTDSLAAVYPWELLLTSGDAANNPYAGKRAVFLGDSVTAGGDYPARVGSRLGLAGTVNGGFGGARLTEQFDAQGGLTGVDMADSIASGDWTVQTAAANAGGGKIATVNALATVDWLATDYLILFYGTNDHSASVPLGEITENNRTTVNGAMNYINTKIITKYPHLKILWLTPMYRSNYATNALGNTLLQTVDVIIERAQRFNLPVFDLYREGGINSINVTHFYKDTVHPNSGAGYTHLANKVAAKFSAIF